jgi:CTP:molybdopterin cytidylyltransferase MocA
MSKPSLVVMAAGIGSRYGGLKQIDPIGPNGEIIIDYFIYDALNAGFGGVVFIIKRDIEEAFPERVGKTIEKRCAPFAPNKHLKLSDPELRTTV